MTKLDAYQDETWDEVLFAEGTTRYFLPWHRQLGTLKIFRYPDCPAQTIDELFAVPLDQWNRTVVWQGNLSQHSWNQIKERPEPLLLAEVL